ncbi:MAG: hypothetical protein PVJ53_04180 [Desulfobacterales bacterium]|jgi:hypothetical protein
MTVSRKEAQERKRLIYDSLSPRNRKYIDRIGYEKWDPFEEPKDPIDIRRDTTRRTSQQLVREFLQSRPLDAPYSNAYGRGVLDMCLGIINDDERYLAMLDFAVWYSALLKREGKQGD